MKSKRTKKQRLNPQPPVSAPSPAAAAPADSPVAPAPEKPTLPPAAAASEGEAIKLAVHRVPPIDRRADAGILLAAHRAAVTACVSAMNAALAQSAARVEALQAWIDGGPPPVAAVQYACLRAAVDSGDETARPELSEYELGLGGSVAVNHALRWASNTEIGASLSTAMQDLYDSLTSLRVPGTALQQMKDAASLAAQDAIVAERFGGSNAAVAAATAMP